MKRLRFKKLIKSTKAKVLVGLVVVLLFSAGAWALSTSDNEAGNTDQSGGANTSEDQAATGPAPDLNPPTEAQKKYTDDYKKSLSQPPPPSTITPSGKKQVYPVVTSVSSSEVKAYVEGVTEDGGTCTATATQGSLVESDSSTGFANVSYTSCPPINLSLAPGSWVITLSYTSNTSEGKTTQTFEVK